jgi:hypothetical protein
MDRSRAEREKKNEGIGAGKETDGELRTFLVNHFNIKKENEKLVLKIDKKVIPDEDDAA